MKKYTLEIFIDEKDGVGVHESADPLNIHDARILISVMEEYKARLLSYIIMTQQSKSNDLSEGKKVE